jgi:hypothetical protein
MKKYKVFLATNLILVAISSFGQVIEHIDISTAGTLKNHPFTSPVSTITDLTLTGNIDARDIQFMRDSMDVLENIDLSGTTIVAYIGTDGTVLGYNVYLANHMPAYSFCSQRTGAKITLRSVVFPSGLICIDNLAFQGCRGLNSIILPSGLDTIGTRAFFHCSGLTSIMLPPSLNKIKTDAFTRCSGLIEIHVKAINPPSLDNRVFGNVPDSIPVYVPCDKEIVYKNVSGWGDYFTNIKEDCTEIENLFWKKQYAIYPNPSTANVSILLPENVQNAFFILYDMQGKMLIRQEVSNQDAVSVNKFASGMYIYKITTAKEIYTGKLTINN